MRIAEVTLDAAVKINELYKMMSVSKQLQWMLIYMLFHVQSNDVSAAVVSCRSRLTGSSGTFVSPHYPDEESSTEGLEDYFTSRHSQKKYIRCQWEIEVEAGKGIQLKFGEFDIRAPIDDCDKGEVDVFSGTGKQKTRLDKYCSGDRPDTVISRNNTVTVVFRRPVGFEGRGFLISYIAITPGETISDFVSCSDTGKKHVQMEFYSVTCPVGCANITSHVVIGDLPYREDSHICRSAVHAGVISDDFGGRIKIRREIGKSLYIGSTANNISTTTGPMADFQINFPEVASCHDQIKIAPNQLSASSFLNESDFYGRYKAWPPSEAILSSILGAWFPGVNSKPQWLQVDLRKTMNVTGVITRGSSNPYTYTKSYTISYSNNNITWFFYKEEDHLKPKIFGGNKNSFSKVRNNFVRPTIRARYIRVYPNSLLDDDFSKQGLKVGFTGCELSEDEEIEDILPPPPPPPVPNHTTTSSSTAVITPTPTLSTKNVNKTVESTTQGNDDESKFNEISITENGTGVVDSDLNIDKEVDKVPEGERSDLSERSIIIIGIVAALAVTSILLATLVLVLVRKRKKEPKHNTMIPKLTSQTNVTYNATIGMPYTPSNNNNQDRKKSKKTSKKQNPSKNGTCIENAPLNGISFENSSARGGPTLQYDQQLQPLVKGPENDQKGPHISVSYSRAGTSQMQSLKPLPLDERACILDDEDHEYQVIPDPVIEFGKQSFNSRKSSSNGCSMGARSNNSDCGPWKQGALWGKAGDEWSKGSTPEKNQLTFFGNSNNGETSPPLFHSGSFSRKDHLSVNKESPVPFSSPNPNSASKSSSKQFLRSNSTVQSTQNSSQLGPPYQRFSSSSTGSSHSRSDGSYGHRKTPLYSSVPNGTKNNSTSRDSEFVFASSSPKQHQSGTNPPPKIPNCNDVYPPVFSPTPNGLQLNRNEPNSDFTKEPEPTENDNALKANSNRNHVRSDYDQLYRKKTPIEEQKSLVAMTSNNYDQLNLNTAV